jgi:glycosyltransferase involved in cell wall biosynthesis
VSDLPRRLQEGIARRSRRTLGPLPGWVFSLRARLDSRPAVAYLAEGTGWVIDEIGEVLRGELGERCLMRVGCDPRGYRGVTLHYGSSPLYLKNARFRAAHPSNRLLFTWSHGLPSNPDPNIQEQIAYLREGAAWADRVHVWTTTARDFLRAHDVPAEKIVHIPLGVDTRLFRPSTSAERSAARTRLEVPEDAICVGSFQKDSPGWDNANREMKWIKGPDVLADVLERLAQRYRLFVLLTSPARGYLIERLERAGIAYRHDVLPDQAALASHYHALDLYLITSRDEGGPMSLLEGMASGVPLISTRMGMPKDVIGQGETGLLAEVDDVEGLVSAAQRLIDNRELATRIAQEARRAVLSYDWALIADKYARMLYNLSPKIVDFR